LPVRVVLYMPEAISKDSIEVNIGDAWNWTHLFMLRSGSSIAAAIEKSVSASVNEIVVYDTLRDPKQREMDPSAFIIVPEVIRRDATIWPSAWNLSKKL
jgi:hypothetical protein